MRLPILEDDEIDEEQLSMIESLGDRNVFRTLANNPDIFDAVSEYVSSLYAELPSRERELVILAVARSFDSEYEWHQHVDIAQLSGISLEKVRGIGGGELDSFDERERTLIEYVEATCNEEVTDELHGEITEYYDDSEIVAIGHLVGFYAGLSKFIRAIDLPLEDEFVGWEPEE
ncbi:MAG: carboxymuconolactone decarboxylase family protein [Halobacteria archaeon]|nr:carboxymuconolactone decarboxylase family protein [Halobacteria archaeon]